MPSERLVVGPVEVIPAQLLVRVEGNVIWLRRRQMLVLAELASYPGRVLRRETIFEVVWGRTPDARDRTIDVYVGQLRRLLVRAGPGWKYIHTHVGGGYRFEPQARSGARP